MEKELAQKLIALADKYEKTSFADGDPSHFLRWYKEDSACIEASSFIAAMLAFGNRKLFIPKIELILTQADSQSGSIKKWLTHRQYKKSFPSGQKKFYRFYSYDDMQIFFDELADILEKEGSLGSHFQKLYEESGTNLADLISQAFPKSRIVPKGRTSANKRIHMFLRWMVRQNSPLDLGLWSWYSPALLILPLDVHVMQEAQKLGLLPQKAAASRKCALFLTRQMQEIFPDDPCRADYALFGLGVDQ